jgi:hypothetical protein
MPPVKVEEELEITSVSILDAILPKNLDLL